jgi:hypothetical protein
MGNRVMALACFVLMMLALPVKANEKPTETFQQAMRSNSDAMQIMRDAAKELGEAGAGVQDYEPFEKTTPTMKASFATMLAFWQAQKVDDAVTLTKKGTTALTELEAAVKDRDYRTVLASLTSLGETCTSCHMAHRVRLADNTYEIK